MKCRCTRNCFHHKFYRKGDIVDISEATGCTHFEAIEEPKRRKPAKEIDEILPVEPDPEPQKLTLEDDERTEVIGVVNIKNSTRRHKGKYVGDGFAGKGDTKSPAWIILKDGKECYMKKALWKLDKGELK